MTKAKTPNTPDEEAPLFEAMAHPFRVAIRNELRKENGLTIAELRRRVSAAYEEIDTRNIQFHLFRLQMMGVVATRKEGKKERVDLVLDLSLSLTQVKGAKS